MSSLGGKLLRLERAAARQGACLVPAGAEWPFSFIPELAFFYRKRAPERSAARARLALMARSYRLLVRAGLPPEAPWPEEYFERVPPALARAAAECREWCAWIDRLVMSQCYSVLASQGLADWSSEENGWVGPGEGDETGEPPEKTDERWERSVEFVESKKFRRMLLGIDPYDEEAVWRQTQLHRNSAGFGGHVFEEVLKSLRDLLDEEE